MYHNIYEKKLDNGFVIKCNLSNKISLPGYGNSVATQFMHDVVSDGWSNFIFHIINPENKIVGEGVVNIDRRRIIAYKANFFRGQIIEECQNKGLYLELLKARIELVKKFTQVKFIECQSDNEFSKKNLLKCGFKCFGINPVITVDGNIRLTDNFVLLVNQ